MRDVDFLRDLFDQLDKANITYAILRKSETISSGRFNDIDWVIDYKRKDDFDVILNETCIRQKWELDMRIQKNGFEAIRLHSLNEMVPVLLHFDLFDFFAWEDIIIYNNTELLEERYVKGGFYSVSKSVECVIELLTRLLFKGYIKNEYRDNIHEVFSTNLELRKKLLYVFGNKTAEFIAKNVIEKKWEVIENNVAQIRRYAKATKWKSDPFHFITDKIRFWLYNFVRLFQKHGIIIVFEGVDGSGKSTVIESLPQIMYRSYDESYIDCYHWRPCFIKKEKADKHGEKVVVTHPHAKKPYGKLLSLAKFLFYNVDYILGYLVKIKWQVAKGHLIIFDRYYYDYYTDKIRYRLSISDYVIDFFKFIIPKPDITFLMIGDPEILYRRKQEISLFEIEKQIETLLEKKNKFSNPVVINVNESIEMVCGKVCNCLLAELSKRM